MKTGKDTLDVVSLDYSEIALDVDSASAFLGMDGLNQAYGYDRTNTT